ncbi:D-aminoacyl-tRNA deacylase [Nosema granulosis]|uniref:D-aminoacyl-tRNA deacylase n=1 Tax=Nosema granulosis TaxID=83296 RepID=A0A9P6H1K2_9MICR|nr:D-aminoacyl-tRNA deacylase [Nosema granulosis]
MRAIIQKVKSVNSSLIGEGCVVFLGISKDDTTEKANWMAEKLLKLRLYDGWKTNIFEKSCDILIKIEQSVLDSTNCSSVESSHVENIYLFLYSALCKKYSDDKVKMVQFGSNEPLEIVNDGPFTACLEK